MLAENVREGQRTGQTSGHGESIERANRGNCSAGEEREGGEIVGEDGLFQGGIDRHRARPQCVD